MGDEHDTGEAFDEHDDDTEGDEGEAPLDTLAAAGILDAADAKRASRRLTDADASRLFRALDDALCRALDAAGNPAPHLALARRVKLQVRRAFGLRLGLAPEQVRAVERRGRELLRVAAIASAAVDAADPARMPTEPAPPEPMPAAAEPMPAAAEPPRALDLALLVEPLARAASGARLLADALDAAHNVVRSLVGGR